MQMMEKECPMFCGIYWAYDRMDMLMMLKEKMPRYNYIIGTMCSMMGYMSMGLDAISMTAMNCMPEMMKVRKAFVGYSLFSALFVCTSIFSSGIVYN